MMARRGLGSLVPVAAVVFLSLAPCLVDAQFAPYRATGLTTIASPVDPSIKISYKIPQGVCTTAFDTQKQYTGWVAVPGVYPTNLFFWFIAGREPTPALTIWLNGGPGSSSMFGLFTEMGPCEVIEKGADRLETAVREWGWDRASNMLFIDQVALRFPPLWYLLRLELTTTQPNQVGFSYDVPTNGSADHFLGMMSAPPRNLPRDRTPSLFMNGTFASLNPNNTANSTKSAGVAVWHLLQAFLSTFPEYNPPGGRALGVNLFAESYGGKYGPAFAEMWEEQNIKQRLRKPANTTVDIRLTSLGIVNGWVDDIVQDPFYAAMAINNTYGLQLITPVRARLANGSFYEAGGCRDLVMQCRNASSVLNSGIRASIDTTNALCQLATETCRALMDPYLETGRSFYDIAHGRPDSFPPNYYVEYLNTRPVQEAIGSVVNYTDTSPAVYEAFAATGDLVRDAMIPKLASLLSRGVRVGFIYGDRDYICNWLGGEAVSLSVASAAGGAYATLFPAAGYAPIIVNDSYIGGAVRQFGNLSFSRIYQAGHFVPAYQPETAFQVFARIITGTSVSTGEIINLGTYNTTGPANATSSLKLPPSPTATCYVRAMGSTCPSEAVQSLLRGEGVIINGVWYPASSSWPGATMTTTGSGGPSGPTSSPTLTGLFTATSTPDSSARRACASFWVLGFAIVFNIVNLHVM